MLDHCVVPQGRSWRSAEILAEIERSAREYRLKLYPESDGVPPPRIHLHRPGERFGRLVVVRFAEMRRDGKVRAAVWWCRCDCGNTVRVRGKDLRNCGTQSCGCLTGRPRMN